MTERSLSLRVPATAGLRRNSEASGWEPAVEAVMEQLIAELYLGKRGDELLATVAGSEARVLGKASRLARELGMPVEVVIAGRPGVLRVSATGKLVSGGRS